MKIKEYIERIIGNGKSEDMEELSDMLDEAIMKVKINDPKCYKKYKMKLMGMAYNYKFDRETAKEIVEDIQPLGEVLTIQETTNVKNQYVINADDNDFYIVINSLVNDYNNVIDKEDVETYVKIANAFINDTDSVKDKIWIYYNEILKRD